MDKQDKVSKPKVSEAEKRYTELTTLLGNGLNHPDAVSKLRGLIDRDLKMRPLIENKERIARHITHTTLRKTFQQATK